MGKLSRETHKKAVESKRMERRNKAQIMNKLIGYTNTPTYTTLYGREWNDSYSNTAPRNRDCCYYPEDLN